MKSLHAQGNPQFQVISEINVKRDDKLLDDSNALTTLEIT